MWWYFASVQCRNALRIHFVFDKCWCKIEMYYTGDQNATILLRVAISLVSSEIIIVMTRARLSVSLRLKQHKNNKQRALPL